MPDISMCQNADCLIREKCYRYRAIPTYPVQAYSQFVPVNGDCKDHWPIEDRRDVFPMSEIEKDAKGPLGSIYG